MILDNVQKTLDALLYKDKVYVFWNRAKKLSDKANEYVVYNQSDGPTGIVADNKPLTRNIGITVRYYYNETLEGTKDGRTLIRQRAESILSAMEAAGFITTTGLMWLGDIDGVGKGVVVIDFVYSEVL